jgi:hypothetical protein
MAQTLSMDGWYSFSRMGDILLSRELANKKHHHFFLNMPFTWIRELPFFRKLSYLSSSLSNNTITSHTSTQFFMRFSNIGKDYTTRLVSCK